MKRILCIGDSNTYGFDPRSYMGSRYPKDLRWTGILEKAGYDVINCGQNGMSVPREGTFHMIRNLICRLMPVDILTVMYGSNDLLMGASAKQAAAHMEKLLEMLISCPGETQIILLAPPPMQPGSWVEGREQIRESVLLAEEYRALAGKLRIPFGDAGDWGTGLTFDGVHLTPEGHEAFAEGLLTLLRRTGKDD